MDATQGLVGSVPPFSAPGTSRCSSQPPPGNDKADRAVHGTCRPERKQATHGREWILTPLGEEDNDTRVKKDLHHHAKIDLTLEDVHALHLNTEFVSHLDHALCAFAHQPFPAFVVLVKIILQR